MSVQPDPTTAAELGTITLAPPEVLVPVARASVNDLVPIKSDEMSVLDSKVERFAQGIVDADLGSEEFKSKLDAAHAMGRQSIANSSAVSQRFMDKNFVGMEDSAAFKAINGLRNVFQELNPAREGDLLAPNRLLGIIPFGNKLQAYFRKYESASGQIGKLMEELRSAQDEIRRDVAAMGEMEAKLWEAMGKVKEAAIFAEKLDTRLAGEVTRLKSSDPLKAEAIEQEVLFYARQAHSDLLAQQAVNVNAYRQIGVLKKTGRELINGCDRMATTGMSALATAQAVARATGTQIKVMEMLKASSSAIGDLIEQTSVMLGKHVEQTGEFSSNPVVAIDKLKAAFENTTKAIDSMDKFRSQALDNMAKNNAMLKELIDGAEKEITTRRGVAGVSALDVVANPGESDVPQ
jgi:uncharacterized protein YaaN involved in tellurite resistance